MARCVGYRVQRDECKSGGWRVGGKRRDDANLEGKEEEESEVSIDEREGCRRVEKLY